MIGSHALHLLAWLSLRARPPLAAKRLVDFAGRLLPEVGDFDEARRLSRRLRGGTCLSRALTVAARTRGAEVVISVRPGETRDVDAHAWVEIDSVPLIPTDVVGEEIARLGSRRRR